MAKADPKLAGPTIQDDPIDFNDAEDFKLPSDGVHDGNLTNVELAVTKKTQDLPPEDQREQFVVTVTLGPEDQEAPNLPMRLYVGWPYPEDKETMWGGRTAYGAKIKAIKDLMTAFGGQESGLATKEEILSYLYDQIGMAVKVQTKQSKREDTDEMQANISRLLPA